MSAPARDRGPLKPAESHSRSISPEAIAIAESRHRALTGELGVLGRKHSLITLELGCGHGHFLTDYAGRHPDRFCIGVDRQANRIGRSFRKQERAGLANLKFMRAEVGQFLECLPDGMQLARIFVLFPDPWPKRKHIKNRMLGPSMLGDLVARARPDTALFMRTDDDVYFEWVVANLRESCNWQIDPEGTWPFERETVFQRKARAWRSLAAVVRQRGSEKVEPHKQKAL